MRAKIKKLKDKFQFIIYIDNINKSYANSWSFVSLNVCYVSHRKRLISNIMI